jgi:hypothetical protein
MAISTSDVDEHQVEAIEAVTIAAASDGEQGISNGQEEKSRSQDYCGEPHSSDPSAIMDDPQTDTSCSSSIEEIAIPMPTDDQ